MSAKKFRIIHFNDVYNIEVSKSEPIGGAARFITTVKDQIAAADGADTLVTFAGDAFSPAPLTYYTNGEEIPPVLNAAGVTVSCVGNHELDNGIDTMKKRVSECNFPWVMSNLDDVNTGKPVGDVNRSVVIEKSGVKIGFFGLGSLDWVDSLTAIPQNQLKYTDVVEASDNMAAELRAQNCDVIIAVTHLMQPDDERVAREAKDVDIVLGGHDHVIWTTKINGRWAVKAGTDFKNLATIDFEVSEDKSITWQDPVIITVTGDVTPDPDMENYVKEATEPLRDPALDKNLAICKTMLDGRFLSIRTQETGLGNLVCDAIADIARVPNVMYNSGSFRADNLDPPSPWTARELEAVLAFHNQIVVLRFPGDKMFSCLEYAVNQYPLLAGRFLQVSGLKFTFDPRKPVGQRVDRTSAYATDDNGELVLITADKSFTVAVNQHMYERGLDGTPTPESDLVRKDELTGPQMVAAYLRKIETDVDKDGNLELGIVSPKQEGRITCVAPDPDIVAQYPY